MLKVVSDQAIFTEGSGAERQTPDTVHSVTKRFTATFCLYGVLSVASLFVAGNAAANELRYTLQGEVRFDDEPVREAVVYLVREGETERPSPMTLTITQDGLVFHPPFAVATPGSVVRFENHDLEIHNVKSDSPGNRFDLGAHMPGQIREVVLKRAEAVRLRCKIHDRMRAIIYVAPSADFAVTDDDGRFAIGGLLPGSYRAVLWHQRLRDEEVEAAERVVLIEDRDIRLDVALKPSSPTDAILPDSARRDWLPVVDDIEQRLEEGLTRWKKGSTSGAARTVMQAHAQLYGGSGLKEAIIARIGADRSARHEERFSRLVQAIQSEKLSPELEAGWKRERVGLLDELRRDARAINSPDGDLGK